MIWLLSSGAWCQGAPQRVIDDLFHWAMFAMDGVLDQPGNVIIESQGGSHVDIVMPSSGGVKMLPCAQGGRPRRSARAAPAAPIDVTDGEKRAVGVTRTGRTVRRNSGAWRLTRTRTGMSGHRRETIACGA